MACLQTLAAPPIFFYLLQKWVYLHKTTKQPINLKLQPIHLTTELFGPLITAKLTLLVYDLG